MVKTLVIYYSRKGENYVNGRIEKLTKGNTEIVAEFIQKAVDADIFEIETKKAYAADYNMTRCHAGCLRRTADEGRPPSDTFRSMPAVL